MQDAPGTGRTASNAIRLDTPDKAQQRKDREEVRFPAAAWLPRAGRRARRAAGPGCLSAADEGLGAATPRCAPRGRGSLSPRAKARLRRLPRLLSESGQALLARPFCSFSLAFLQL